MWTVPSLSAWKFWKIRDDFDPDGQLDSIAPEARSNPTARRGRNYLEIFMQTETELSTLSMGQSMHRMLVLPKSRSLSSRRALRLSRCNWRSISWLIRRCSRASSLRQHAIVVVVGTLRHSQQTVEIAHTPATTAGGKRGGAVTATGKFHRQVRTSGIWRTANPVVTEDKRDE